MYGMRIKNGVNIYKGTCYALPHPPHPTPPKKNNQNPQGFFKTIEW